MRVAVAGKGGSGKTTIAGSMARLLARRGRAVVAIDGDNNPNLAQVLGLGRAGVDGMEPLPGDLLLKREEEGGTRVELALPPAELFDRFGRRTPEGVRLVLMSRVDHAGAG